MDKKRIDYSELVAALRENEKGKANQILAEVMPRLKDYLMITMDAEEQDAEDCVHKAFLDVYEQIIKGNIKDEKYIFSYLLQTCRNEYLTFLRDNEEFNLAVGEDTGHLVEPAEQVKKLLDEDKQRLLKECLEEMLEEDERALIEYLIENPDATTKEVSKHFDISEANVRTRKSRLTSRLHHCFRRKWKK